jgi:hypothetical protein
MMSLVMRLGWPGFRPSLLPFWNLFWGVGLAMTFPFFPYFNGNNIPHYGSLALYLPAYASIAGTGIAGSATSAKARRLRRARRASTRCCFG